MDGVGGGGGGGDGGGGGGGSEGEKKKVLQEGEIKVKRKMKTASQLEILEKTYAVETYPSEALRADLSVQLGLSDRQLQMWFCHRRLKDKKAPPLQPAKRQRKDASSAPPPAAVGGVGVEMVAGEAGIEHFSGSASGSSPFGHLERVLPRGGTAVARIVSSEIPAMKRYYEPPQAISELRAISFVEAQLGGTLREDGPILGMEFDPLPPGAFGAPIMAAAQQKPAIRPYEAKLFERPDAKLAKGTSRALHEYQFLPEQPSVRSDSYERAVPSHYYGSPTDVPINRTSLSTSRSSMHGSEQVPFGYGLQGQSPTLSVLPQQGRQSHLLPSVSGDHDTVPRKNAIVSVGMDAHFGALPITGLDNPFVSPDKRVSHEDEILRMERKRKSEEVRIAREVEAHEKKIRKELEKQDLLRRKREEQMRKEMERQDRERRKEEERLLREKQREEERYQREQRREMERREKFLQKESIRAEKLRLKEEMRKEKEAARAKAANDRATARRIAKESMELIDDERLELMEIAASSRGLPSILSLDSETLQSLESLRDMLPEFPPKSVHLKKPFSIQPWVESEENIGHLLMVWRFLITFADVLGLWPFTLDEFIQAFHDYDTRLLGEIHVALLKSIIKDIEDVARTPATGQGPNQNSAANPGGGHPQIVEGAYAWGFDIRSWQHHLNPLTWPEILRQFALAAGYGPKLKKRSSEQAYPRDENEGNDGEGIISDLRNGAAAENALAIMQERGFSNRRKSRHRLTPGTVKFAAFHVLSLEGSSGLTILEVAEKIQRSGLRDLTTSKTPEASIAAALSRDTKLFERTAPSTYCVRAPYRKDPADGEVILTEAREKIQVFKNGYFDGEEADDAERDDAEKDEDSESDVGEDPGVDDIGIKQKLNEDGLLSSEPDRMVEKSLSGSMIISHSEAMKTSESSFGESASQMASMESVSLKELKVTGSSVEQSSVITGIPKGVTVPAQEDTVIDESNSGEPWVQGLTEGEYSDLSVEERLHALVALIGVANEGNSIRIILEERLEAANALKKQMWAEAQVDKRRFREEFVMKVQYPSFVGNRAEQNTSIAGFEDRQSPQLAIDDKNALASIHPVVHPEHLTDPRNDSNNLDDLPTERNLLQDFSVGSDNLQLQQPGYVSEKSRSQLKAFIGHKAEKMYVYRSLPLGQDRRRNRYWQFITSASRNDPGSGRIFVELRDGRWRLIDCEESFNRLLASLDVRGLRESHLQSMLQMIEVSVKETFKKNTSCIATKSQPLVEDNVRTGALETASRPDCSSSIDSPNSTLCSSNSDNSECSSSFVIGLGRDETEKNDALKRYREFEKWLWEECFNSSILCAMKYGETRCKPLLGICDYCSDLYFFEGSYCPSCCRPNNLNFSEQLAHFKEKLKGEPYLFSHEGSSPFRIRLLKAQLALIEACILDEALQTAWSEDYRRSWGMKLLTASSVEALLQVLTLLEVAIKRDFLSSNYETTYELLGSPNSAGYVNNGFVSPETVSVLPWLPQTTSSMALRLMELDMSIFYKLSQKEDAEKDKGTGDFMTPPSKYAAMKNVVEGELLEANYESGNLQQEPWVDPGSGHISSGRGRGGRTRGRGCSRGGRSQRRAIGQRSNAPNGGRSRQLVGWKGQARGRGGRRRGRRTIRSKQKPMKKATDDVISQREKQEDAVFENSADASLQAWNVEEEETTGLQFTNVENASSSSERSEYENDNGPESGDEYEEDLVVDGYSNVYAGRTERFMSGVDYGVNGEEEDDRALEDDEDDINEEDDDDDEQGEVDVDGFFNGDSDENRDVGGEQIGNPDDITESSSGYSD